MGLKVEELGISCPFNCDNKHKCVVIGIGFIPDLLKVVKFAGQNEAFCLDDDEAGDDIFFVRVEGEKKQRYLTADNLMALLRQLENPNSGE